MKTLPRTTIFSLVILTLVLSACAPSPAQIATSTAAAETAIATLWTPTPTSTATSTATPTPISTATPTATPEPTSTPTAAPTPASSATPSGAETYNVKDVTFTFVPPGGWYKNDAPDQVVFNVPMIGGDSMVLSFSVDQYSMLGAPMDADEIGIALFSAHVQDRISEMSGGVQNISEEFFDTPAGEPYFRWELTLTTKGQAKHMVFYIFGSGQSFLTIMYGRPETSAADMDARVDAAIQAISIEP